MSNLYRVNKLEYEALQNMRKAILNIPENSRNNDAVDRLDHVEHLLSIVKGPGAQVDGNTLSSIRGVKDEYDAISGKIQPDNKYTTRQIECMMPTMYTAFLQQGGCLKEADYHKVETLSEQKVNVYNNNTAEIVIDKIMLAEAFSSCDVEKVLFLLNVYSSKYLSKYLPDLEQLFMIRLDGETIRAVPRFIRRDSNEGKVCALKVWLHDGHDYKKNKQIITIAMNRSLRTVLDTVMRILSHQTLFAK